MITALDAMQTWTSALRSNPDLIVLDINMPAGNGLDILRRLRAKEKTQHIPVIVVTGEGTAAIEATARSLGAAEFFRKPLDPDLLCAAVERALAAPKPPEPASQQLGTSVS